MFNLPLNNKTLNKATAGVSSTNTNIVYVLLKLTVAPVMFISSMHSETMVNNIDSDMKVMKNFSKLHLEKPRDGKEKHQDEKVKGLIKNTFCVFFRGKSKMYCYIR